MASGRGPLQDTQSGMSLIEVLVAVFIMALAAGMIVLTIRPKDDALSAAALRLQHDVEAALDTALVTGNAQGLQIGPTGYRQFVWKGETWIPALVPPVAFKRNVAVDQSRDRSTARTKATSILPDIVLDATGVAAGEPIILMRGRDRIELVIAPDGTVTWEAPNA
jgi:type II secretion system protein H